MQARSSNYLKSPLSVANTSMKKMKLASSMCIRLPYLFWCIAFPNLKKRNADREKLVMSLMEMLFDCTDHCCLRYLSSPLELFLISPIISCIASIHIRSNILYVRLCRDLWMAICSWIALRLHHSNSGSMPSR